MSSINLIPCSSPSSAPTPAPATGGNTPHRILLIIQRALESIRIFESEKYSREFNDIQIARKADGSFTLKLVPREGPLIINKKTGFFPAKPPQQSDVEDHKTYSNIKNCIRHVLKISSLMHDIEGHLSLRSVLLKILISLKYDEAETKSLLAQKDKNAIKSLCESKGYSLNNIKERLAKLENDNEKINRTSFAIYLLLTNYNDFLDKNIETIFLFGAWNKEDSDNCGISFCINIFNMMGVFSFSNIDMSIKEALYSSFLQWMTKLTILNPKCVFTLINNILNHNFKLNWEEVQKSIVFLPVDEEKKQSIYNLIEYYFTLRKSAELNPFIFSNKLAILRFFPHSDSEPDRSLPEDLSSHIYTLWNASFDVFIQKIKDVKVDMETVYQTGLRSILSQLRCNASAAQKEFNERNSELNEIIRKLANFIHYADFRKERLLEGLMLMKKYPVLRPVYRIKFIENLEKMLHALIPFKVQLNELLFKDRQFKFYTKQDSNSEKPDQFKELLNLADTLGILAQYLIGIAEMDEQESAMTPIATTEDIVISPEKKRRMRHRKVIEATEVYEEEKNVSEIAETQIQQSQPLQPSSEIKTLSTDLRKEKMEALKTAISTMRTAPLNALTPYVIVEKDTIEQRNNVELESISDTGLKQQSKVAQTESHDHFILASQGFELFVNTLIIKDFRCARVALRAFLLDCCISLEQHLERQKGLKGLRDKTEHHSLVRRCVELNIPINEVMRTLDQGHLMLRYTQDYRPLDKNEPLALLLQWLDHLSLIATQPNHPEHLQTLKNMLQPIFDCFKYTCITIGYSQDLPTICDHLQSFVITSLEDRNENNNASYIPSPAFVKLQNFITQHENTLKQKCAPYDPTVPLKEALDYLEIIEIGKQLQKSYPEQALAFFHLRHAAEGEKVIRALLKVSAICYGFGILAGHHYNNYIKPLASETDFHPFSTQENKLLESNYLGIGHHYLHINPQTPYIQTYQASIRSALGFQNTRKMHRGKHYKQNDFMEQLDKIYKLVVAIIENRLKKFCNLDLSTANQKIL